MISETVNDLAALLPADAAVHLESRVSDLQPLFADIDWHFLSYGYVSVDSAPSTLSLDHVDEAHRPFVQLYHHVAESAEGWPARPSSMSRRDGAEARHSWRKNTQPRL